MSEQPLTENFFPAGADRDPVGPSQADQSTHQERESVPPDLEARGESISKCDTARHSTAPPPAPRHRRIDQQVKRAPIS